MDIGEETRTVETIMKSPACLWVECNEFRTSLAIDSLVSSLALMSNGFPMGECDIGYEGEWTGAVCGHTCTSISVFGEQGSASGTHFESRETRILGRVTLDGLDHGTVDLTRDHGVTRMGKRLLRSLTLAFGYIAFASLVEWILDSYIDKIPIYIQQHQKGQGSQEARWSFAIDI
ncbi:hypothetical protein Tco_0889158 [Tanacetum coccineum]